MTSPVNAEVTSVIVPASGSVDDPANNDLLVEVSADDGSAAGTAFYIGSTTAAETHPSFISSTSCNIAGPTPIAAIGYPDMHVIEAVYITD
ncbi:MAG: hypothetical protein ACTHK2_12510 [Dokdonella sp.]|uniref:hypothetical protein n=1 Tax=Dokdonella sp. TaxID=2291710 RepID=UPI003F7FD68A